MASITAAPCPSSAAQSGASPAATRAASDEIRASAAVTSHVRHAAIPTGQASASSRPRKVATPLPPWNRSQTG